ncbi:hypothetical protein [Kitasatospora aburaviensis]|uniref:DUF317 domain-containing protein n=1 Tax=Kitasatospora aburaviensis TaxID=67265 RepID=A0ABW1F5R3_9ACTN
MGLDITVVMADWAHLARAPAQGRLEALEDAVFPDFCCERCEDANYAVEGGWVWRPRDAPWCAEYRFFSTTGSYSWHFHLANAWEDVRPLAAPDLREALDRFAGGLFWDGPYDPAAEVENDDSPAPARGFPADPAPWRPHVLLLRAPDEVPALARAWEVAAPRLEELREPFATEAAPWPARPRTFDAAVALLHEWGEVVTRAGDRGWGLIGLR